MRFDRSRIESWIFTDDNRLDYFPTGFIGLTNDTHFEHAFMARDDGFDFEVDDKDKAAQAVLDGVRREFDTVRSLVKRGKLTATRKIRKRVTEILSKYDVANHIEVDVREDDLAIQVKPLGFPVVLKWANPLAVQHRLKDFGIRFHKLQYANNYAELARHLSVYEKINAFPMLQEYCCGRVDRSVSRSRSTRRIHNSRSSEPRQGRELAISSCG